MTEARSTRQLLPTARACTTWHSFKEMFSIRSPWQAGELRPFRNPSPVLLLNWKECPPVGRNSWYRVLKAGQQGEGSLWVVPTLMGSRHRLGNIVSSAASWSADGQTIAFAKGGTLNLARSDGSGTHTILTLDGKPSWIRWSPDAKKLRLTVADLKTGSESLWEAAADGTNPHPLLPGWNNPPSECCGGWTPDGRYFVFQSTRNGRSDVWVMREKQGFLTRGPSMPAPLTSGPLNFLSPVP